MTGNLQEVLDLRRWREVRFDPADRALLNFAEGFTGESHKAQAKDIEVLRSEGFSDQDIIAMTLCAGYRHYITRIADATGIEVDSELEISPILVQAYGHDRRESIVPVERAEGGSESTSKHGPWVEMSKSPRSDPILAPVWSRWTSEFGYVPGLLKALSLLPEPVRTLDVFWRMACLGSTSLGRELEALIGVTVGSRIPSPWLSSFYEGVLSRVGGTGSAKSGSKYSGRESLRSRRGEIVLAFVRKITERASSIVSEDIAGVRETGLSDSAILEVIVATALLNGIGRMANVLGVPNDEPLALDSLNGFVDDGE